MTSRGISKLRDREPAAAREQMTSSRISEMCNRESAASVPLGLQRCSWYKDSVSPPFLRQKNITSEIFNRPECLSLPAEGLWPVPRSEINKFYVRTA